MNCVGAWRRVVLVIVLAGVGFACAASRPASPEPRRGDYRIAVATMTANPRALRDADSVVHVGHYFSEALLDRGASVMPPHDAAGLLADLVPSSDFHRDASQFARAAVARLGVDALLLVEVTRWAERDLQTTRSGAAVAFRATLHGGLDGLLLWSGTFSDRQVSFLERPWHAIRYPGWGARWLTVEELARWGCRQLAAEVPLRATRRQTGR